ncbi:pro-resilin-like, partial [Manduca sexta]|uniref:pro-resilin-like n=1 Tax=Manduca sexta TaxID=7130 RepID=UPI00188FFFAF
MKMFIPLLCLLSFTIAEPPVGDSYASARSSHDYDNHDFQRSPSQQYGTPSQILASRNSFNEYGPPKSKSSTTLSSTYGLPTTRISEDYAVPSARNFPKFSQDYGVPDTRSLSQEYGIPETRNIALEYGVPSRKSQNYGTSKSQNALSRGYATKSRNAVSQEYGVPKVRSQSQEPANYDFNYKVNDYITGSDFGHSETRQDNRAEGTYFVVLPDGTKQ